MMSLRLNPGEVFICHITAAINLLSQRTKDRTRWSLRVQMPVSWHPMQLASRKRFPSALSPAIRRRNLRHQQDQ